MEESGGGQLAIVDTVQGNKANLKVGFQARRQQVALRQLQLLCAWAGGVAPPQRLDDAPWQLSPEVLENARPQRRNWGLAWVLLQDTSETVDLGDLVALLCGSSTAAERAACWLELVGGQLWFRSRSGQVQARSLADLRRLRRQRHLKALEQRRMQAWRELLRQRRPVQLPDLTEEQRAWLERLQELAAGRLEPEQLAPPLRQSLVELHLAGDRGELRHLLVDLGLWDPHRLVSISGTPWSHGFSAALLAETERLLQLSAMPRPGDDARLDLSDQHCVTIDDDDTLDIDDGLGLEHRPDGGLRIWIHVADPGRLIEAGSPLDLEARRRGSSLYLAGGTLPMLPEPLSTGALSLRAGVRCAAWSTWVELDEAGAIAAYGLQRSWVRPAFRLSYDDADTLIELAPPQERQLCELDQLMRRRRAWRRSQGALLLDLPEGRVRHHHGSPVLEVTEPSPARQLVAEAMILAGAVAARFGRERQLPLPYRSQLPADLPSSAELEALPDGAVRFAAIKRCLSRGLIGTRPAPHFSLGLPAYVQATSPIRRYGDLIVQRQIGAALQGEAVLDEAGLQTLIDQLDPALREGNGITREDQRHWQQVWFEAHRGDQWRAQFLRWLRPQDRLGLVRLDELALELAADCPQAAQPGQALLVRVQQVDPLRDRLRLVASAG